MPAKVKDTERVLHVPIDGRLLDEFKDQAERKGMTMKKATAEALRIWTGYQEYQAKEENRAAQTD